MVTKQVNGVFERFLFHLREVAVSIDFVRKKFFILTTFAHRKSALWKSR